MDFKSALIKQRVLSCKIDNNARLENLQAKICKISQYYGIWMNERNGRTAMIFIQMFFYNDFDRFSLTHTAQPWSVM